MIIELPYLEGDEYQTVLHKSKKFMCLINI